MKRSFFVFLAATAVLYGLLYASEQASSPILQITLYGISYILPIVAVLRLCPKDTSALIPHPMRCSGRTLRWTLLLFPLVLAVLLPTAYLGAWLFPDETASAAVVLSLPLILRHALLSPLAEEFFFRLLPTRLFSKEQRMLAWLISTLCFAVFHAAPSRILHAVVAATLFFFIDLIADSIWPSVLLHVGNNTVALLYGAYADRALLPTILTVSISVLALAALIYLILRRSYVISRIKSKLNVT